MSSMVLSAKSLKEAVKGLSLLLVRQSGDGMAGEVRVVCGRNGARLSVCNLEQLIEFYDANAECSGEFEFALKLADLREISRLRSLNGRFGFALNDAGVVRVDYDGSVREYVRLEREFPAESEWVDAEHVAVNKAFFAGLRAAAPMVSEAKDAMAAKCILLEPSRIVATNRRQLVVVSCQPGVTKQVVLQLPKLLPLLEDDGELVYDTRFVELVSGAWRTRVKIPPWMFPRYEQVIPKPSTLVQEFTLGVRDHARLIEVLSKIKIMEEHEPVSLCGSDAGVHLITGSVRPEAERLVDSNFSTSAGERTLVFTMARSYLLDALMGGFNRLRSSDGMVITAQSNESANFQVFMGLSSKRPKEEMLKTIGAEVPENNKQEEEKAMENHQENNVETSRGTENFKVVGSRQDDVFAPMSEALEQLRVTLQTLNVCVAEVGKQLREAQRSSKLRERNYRELQSTIDRFRKVANF